MNSLWVLIGVGAAGMTMGVALLIFALSHRRGRVFGILGGVGLMLAAFILLACYVPLFAVPSHNADTGTFSEPAPVDASATAFYLSPADEGYLGTPHASADMLVAVAARTGVIRWQHALPGVDSAYVVNAEVAYVATMASPSAGSTTITAYRGADGATLWQSTMPVRLPIPSQGSLAAAGDDVYLTILVGQPEPGTQPQSEIAALRAADGAVNWQIADSQSVVNPTLAAAPDAVYVSSGSGVQAYRAYDGKLLWSSAQPSSLRTHPLAGTDAVYLPLSGGGFLALRADSGAVICQAGGSFVVKAAALGGGTLYLAGDNGVNGQGSIYSDTIYAYDAATCASRWDAPIKPASAAELVAGDSGLYVQLDYSGLNIDSSLMALRAADGRQLWHSAPPTTSLEGTGWSFATEPGVFGSTLFVTRAVLSGGIHLGASNGRIHLYAMNSTDGSEYWDIPVGHVTTFFPHFVI